MDPLRRVGSSAGEPSLWELVEAFEEMGDRNTVDGWSAAHTARRVQLERSIAALVQAPRVAWSGSRIRCALDVAMVIGDTVVETAIRAVVRGGVLVERVSKRGGTDVTFYWGAPSGARRQPVAGQLVGLEGTYLRVALPPRGEVADRWARRLVIDALRSRVEWKPGARATLA
jgi:hypothetical protein